MLNLNDKILPDGTEFGDFTVLSGADVHGRNAIVDFFHDYWLSKHAGGRLPERADLRPNEMAKFLDHVVIMDVTHKGQGFGLTVRLIGTHVASFYGEISGKDVRDMQNQQAVQRIYHVSEKLLAENAPQLSVTPAFSPDRQYLEAFALYLPLYGMDGEIEKIMVAVDVKSRHSAVRF